MTEVPTDPTPHGNPTPHGDPPPDGRPARGPDRWEPPAFVEIGTADVQNFVGDGLDGGFGGDSRS